MTLSYELENMNLLQKYNNNCYTVELYINMF